MDDSSERGGNASRSSEVGPTIVGGRPLGAGRGRHEIPRGIEVLVKKASVDAEFRKVLLEKRAGSSAEIGLELSAAESAMLNAVPRAQIERIIENTTVPDEQRRVFLGKLGAAMLAALGLGLGGCKPDTPIIPTTGSRSDPPPTPPPQPPPEPPRGIRPDLPPPHGESQSELDASERLIKVTGSRPDPPPPRDRSRK